MVETTSNTKSPAEYVKAPLTGTQLAFRAFVAKTYELAELPISDKELDVAVKAAGLYGRFQILRNRTDSDGSAFEAYIGGESEKARKARERREAREARKAASEASEPISDVAASA